MHALAPPCVQVFREQGLIYMVLEYGDIDLARLLFNHEENRKKSLAPPPPPASAPSASASSSSAGASGGEAAGELGIDENFIRLYWQQMLQVRNGEGGRALQSVYGNDAEWTGEEWRGGRREAVREEGVMGVREA